MVNWNRIKWIKWPIISIFVVIGVLAVIISIGFTFGFLSDAPDGLERVLEDLGVIHPETEEIREFIAGTIAEDIAGQYIVNEDLAAYVAEFYLTEPIIEFLMDEPVWTPILSFIENEYIAGYLGILIAAGIIGIIFYVLTLIKKKT